MYRPAPSLPRLLAAFVIAASARSLEAQYTAVPEPAAYALRGVTVVAADGRRTPNVNLVVRNGVIEAMAPGAQVPAGVRVLEGDSLMVYPGLIDAHGKAGFRFTEPEIDRAQVSAWDAPRVLQGYTPHRRIADALTATGRDFVEQRQAGIVAAAVHPEPALMAGQGAVLLLRPSATTPSQLVVTPSVGALVGLRGGRGVYPGTMYGTTAFLRQALEDARRAGAVRASYARDARGMAMPVTDPDLEAVQQMLGGGRVFFVANSAEEIRFAVELGEQYRFEPVIVGGADAWKVSDLLRRRNVPVLVSVDYGRPRRWRMPTEEPATRGERTDSAQKVPAGAESVDAAIAREQREFEARYANAGRLAAAGVRVALVSNAGRADLREGARTAIRYGLSEADALRALTSTPAELLGLGRLSALGPGAPATFIVTDRPLFDRNARVVYTLVDGSLERGKPASTPAAAPATTASATGAAGATPTAAVAGGVAGRYSVELASQQGTLSGTMTLTGEDAGFAGSIDTEAGVIGIRNGRRDGETMTFTMVLPFMQNMELPVSVTLRDGVITGVSNTPMGEARISGRKLDPREAGGDGDISDDGLDDQSHDPHNHGGPHPVRGQGSSPRQQENSR